MKKQNIIIIIVFGALIFGLGLLGWLTPDQAFSEDVYKRQLYFVFFPVIPRFWFYYTVTVRACQ